LGGLDFVDGVAAVGKGRILLESNLSVQLSRTGIAREALLDHNYKKFDASDWPDEPSGLLGPVRLIPLAAE
jgi:hypothetical protein